MVLIRKTRFIKSWKDIDRPLFAKVVSILAALATLLIGFTYTIDRQGRENLVAHREKANVNRHVAFLNRRMEDLASDLKVVAQNPNLRDYLNNNDNSYLDSLSRQLSDFIEAKEIYDQIRYIDETGMERVRVNLISGKAKVAAHDQLQNKKDRYYFTDTMKLDEGRVFVSPFDLNIEFKQIELPYKPTIRLSTQIVDDRNNKRGIVILNYLGKDLIRRMDEAQTKGEGFVELLSRDGYWLSSQRTALEWGFMFGNKLNLEMLYPLVWEKIQSTPQGQVSIGGNLWTWSRVYPLAEPMISSTGSISPTGKSQAKVKSSDYYWVALIHGPQELPDDIQRDLYLRYSGLWLVSSLIIVIVGWMVALREGYLKRATERAEMANQAKTRFLSSMSHELRTPLNAILGFSQIFTMNKSASRLTEAERADLAEIQKAGEHLLKLINEILELARIDLGQTTLSIEPVSARDIIRSCVIMAKSMAQNYGVSVHDKAKNMDLPLILADQTRAKQCLLNLLSNAVKYNRPGGSVSMECEFIENAFLRLIVRDTGRGIAKRKHHKLFEAFNRLDQEAGIIEGTGIGLVITKELMHRMNGHIGFESEVEKGSTFWLDFPIAKNAVKPVDTADETAHLSEYGEVVDQSAKSILYIEDNPRNIKLMESIIRVMPDISLKTAATAELGLEAAAQEKPDMILMDINLPGMNGIDACKVFKAQESTRDIPIVAISADVMRYKKEKVMEADFASFVSKPFDVPEFIALVRKLLTK